MTRTMNSYRGLTIRNMKVFLKDKMAIFFSLLTQIIVLGLFLLFIKSNYVDGVNDALGELKNMVSKGDIEALVNSWMISGVVGTSVVTAPMSALSVVVSDKEDRIDYDYQASSVKGSVVVMSYFSGAVLCSLITSFALLSFGLIFLALSGTFVLSLTQQLTLYGLVMLGSVSATVILMTAISFFKKNSTFSTFSILVSTLVGFVVGAYIPVSVLSDTMQTVINLIPGAQITGLMRSVFVSPVIDHIDKALGGLDKGMFKAEAEQMFCIRLRIFGSEVDTGFMLLYSVIAIAVFIALNIVLFKYASRRKS